jgi:hypothetical protein
MAYLPRTLERKMDIYTKAVLTVIAIALSVIALQNARVSLTMILDGICPFF